MFLILSCHTYKYIQHPYFNVRNITHPETLPPTFAIDFWTMTTKSDSLLFFIRFVWEIMAIEQLEQINREERKKYARTHLYTQIHRKEHTTPTLQRVPQSTKCSKDKVGNSKGKINGNITRGTHSIWLAIKIRTAFTWHKSSIKRIVIYVYTSIFLCMFVPREQPPASQPAS